MALTTGDVAKQEADALKGRAWFRDMAQRVYGLGEYHNTDGRLSKMRHELRELRTQHVEQQVQQRMCHSWLNVDSVALLCRIQLDEQREEEVNTMLETLRSQTPDIFSWYDESALPSADVATQQLGSFKTGKSWEHILEERRALPDAFAACEKK